MQSFIENIYSKYKYDLDMFGFEPDSCDDIIHDFYIYAWYVKSNPKKYFYVGKGKKDRYRHILWDINALEKNPRKYKGKPYKLLQDNFGIESEILYKELTEKEAIILEAYSIMEYLKNKEPLLNVILPCATIEDEEIMKYRDSYFYEKNEEKFLEYYK